MVANYNQEFEPMWNLSLRDKKPNNSSAHTVLDMTGAIVQRPGVLGTLYKS